MITPTMFPFLYFPDEIVAVPEADVYYQQAIVAFQNNQLSLGEDLEVKGNELLAQLGERRMLLYPLRLRTVAAWYRCHRNSVDDSFAKECENVADAAEEAVKIATLAINTMAL